MKKTLILMTFTMLMSGCDYLNYGGGAVGSWILGLPTYVIKKPLEKMFADGTDDFYEQLLKSRKIVLQNEKLRESLSCKENSDLEEVIKAQKEKNAWDAFPGENLYLRGNGKVQENPFLSLIKEFLENMPSTFKKTTKT